MPVAPPATVNVRYIVHDVDAAIASYTKHLGFTALSNAAPAFADVTLGSLRLLLSGPTSSAERPMPDGARREAGGWNRVHLIVDDLPGEVARLRAAGGVSSISTRRAPYRLYQGRGSDMTFAERAEKRARAIYEAALFSTLMQQESAAAAELGDEFDFDVTLRETLVRMVSKELQKEASDHRETGSR
jgi:hypothetical protein